MYVGIELIWLLKFASLLRVFGVGFVVFVFEGGFRWCFPIILMLCVAYVALSLYFCLSCGMWFCNLYFDGELGL